MKQELLLETYLRDLRLSRFVLTYQSLAQEAARGNLSYERYLLALVQEEVAHRQANRIERAIANAHFPVLKDLADFDWSCVPELPKPRILELAQGGYISRADSPGGQSGIRENTCRNRACLSGLSAGKACTLLQCRRA